MISFPFLIVFKHSCQAELAVHVKKVGDVRRWLAEAFDGGPSGKLKKYRVCPFLPLIASVV